MQCFAFSIFSVSLILLCQATVALVVLIYTGIYQNAWAGSVNIRWRYALGSIGLIFGLFALVAALTKVQNLLGVLGWCIQQLGVIFFVVAVFDASFITDICMTLAAHGIAVDCTTLLSTPSANYMLAAYLDAAAMFAHYLAGAIAVRHAAIINERIAAAEEAHAIAELGPVQPEAVHATQQQGNMAAPLNPNPALQPKSDNPFSNGGPKQQQDSV